MVLPLILAALSAAPKLFSAGTAVYEAISGKPSAAETPEQLMSEVEQLPPEQQAAFTEQMNAKIEAYRAETDRLVNEQGAIDGNITAKISQAAADKIAKFRMLTRPLVVRMMARAMTWPILFLFFVDGTLAVANTLLVGFRVIHEDGTLMAFDLIAGQFFGEASIYTAMYGDLVGPAATIVVAYMTLRQMEKTKGEASPVDAVAGALKGVAGLIKGIRKG